MWGREKEGSSMTKYMGMGAHAIKSIWWASPSLSQGGGGHETSPPPPLEWEGEGPLPACIDLYAACPIDYLLYDDVISILRHYGFFYKTLLFLVDLPTLIC